MNLYELDSRTRKILESNQFLEELTPSEFIEEVSKEHEISLNETSNNDDNLAQLDPKPFIRTFESVLTELKNLKQQNNEEMGMLEKDVMQRELAHSKKMIELNTRISSLTNKFSNLETIVGDVGETINPLGEELQKATNLKEKSLEIIFLTRCYNDFFKYNQSKLLNDLQRSKKSSDKKNCGKYISKLLKLAKKLAPENAKFESVYQEILQFSNNFESNLIDEFGKAYSNENLIKMKECFDILIDFNENSTEIFGTYLDKVESLNRFEKMANGQDPEFVLFSESFMNEENSFWGQISDPMIHFNSNELFSHLGALDSLLDQYKTLISNQFNLIKIIFNKSRNFFLKIFDQFLKKIFTQVGEIYTRLMNFGQSINNLAYVRLLHLFYMVTTEFTKDIKQFFNDNYMKIYLEDSVIKKNNDSSVLLTNAPTEKSLNEELSQLIESNFNDLFSETLTEKNYFDKEKKSLEEIYTKINSSFEKKHPKIFKDKALSVRLATTDTVKDSKLLSPLLSPGLNSKTNNSLEKNRLIQLRKYMKSKLERNTSNSSKFSSLNDSLLLSPKLDQMEGIFSEIHANNDGNPENGETDENDAFDDDIKLTKIDFMIQNSVESLSRISELKPSNIPEYSLEVLRLLIFGIGGYLEFGLEVSYFQLIHLDFKKSETIDFSYLKTINKANRVLRLMTDFIKLIILPLTVNNSNVKRKIINITNGYLTSCELSLNIILKDSIELIVNKIQFCLDKQKKKDFNTTKRITGSQFGSSIDDTLMENEEDTETCQDITKFLEDLYQNQLLGKKLLLGANLQNFMIEIGINLLVFLVNHFKKFQVTEIGSIVLTKDIIRYQQVIDSWKIPELSEKFTILRDLANLFTVQPNYIDSLIKEGQLVNLNPDIIQQYVGKRADYNSSFLNKFGSFI